MAETRVLATLMYNGDSDLLMASEPHSCQSVFYILWKATSAGNIYKLFLKKIKSTVEDST